MLLLFLIATIEISFFCFSFTPRWGVHPIGQKNVPKLKFQWLTIGLMDVNGTINIVNYIVHGE